MILYMYVKRKKKYIQKYAKSNHLYMYLVEKSLST